MDDVLLSVTRHAEDVQGQSPDGADKNISVDPAVLAALKVGQFQTGAGMERRSRWTAKDRGV